MRTVNEIQTELDNVDDLRPVRADFQDREDYQQAQLEFGWHRDELESELARAKSIQLKPLIIKGKIDLRIYENITQRKGFDSIDTTSISDKF